MKNFFILWPFSVIWMIFPLFSPEGTMVMLDTGPGIEYLYNMSLN